MEGYYEYDERLGVITKKSTDDIQTSIQMPGCKCMNIVHDMAEKEPTQRLRTTENAVTKEEDVLSSRDLD